MVKITKVYTRVGDGGSTQLMGKDKIKKTDVRIQACGCLDELNANMGFAVASLLNEASDFSDLVQQAQTIQNELFDLGAHLARDADASLQLLETVINPKVTRLENEIDHYNDQLATLTSFILPGGGESSVRLHLARTVCRRAEIALIQVADQYPALVVLIPYINRLSDWLFVLARWVAKQTKGKELLWQPEKKSTV